MTFLRWSHPKERWCSLSGRLTPEIIRISLSSGCRLLKKLCGIQFSTNCVRRREIMPPEKSEQSLFVRGLVKSSLPVCSLYWTMEATEAMSSEGTVGLTTYHEKCVGQLDDLIVLVRDRNLAAVERCTLEALVVVEVHGKDIIGQLSEKGVDSPKSFDWLAQLRYYWEEDHLYVHQINASLRYGYEYLGNTGRLVITPLTIVVTAPLLVRFT
ncbi:putative dynein heavy chain [Trypanosoma cruzi]|uniref:Putative dynein heavy chain n=1 Tax=Trypanosoma cruzi TaxID=5693 RepID=A0A2V2VM32_TRYCR|nr:putative dynein heavy chain [Trypanosoma cruzi]